MAFAASPSLSALASSSSAAAATATTSSSTPSSNAFHEPRPLHLSLKPVSRLPKPHALSCSAPHIPRAAAGDGSGAGNRGDDSGGNGGNDGGGGGEDDDDYEEAEFGPLLFFDEVLRLAAARGVALPGDMMEAAKDAGIREVLLLRYFDLQVISGNLSGGCERGRFSSFLLMLICVGRSVAARRDDPRLLDAPQPDARRPVVPLQSWHRGGCDGSVIFSSGQRWYFCCC